MLSPSSTGFLAEIRTAYETALADNPDTDFWQVFAEQFADHPGNQVRGTISFIEATSPNIVRDPVLRYKADAMVLDLVEVSLSG